LRPRLSPGLPLSWPPIVTRERPTSLQFEPYPTDQGEARDRKAEARGAEIETTEDETLRTNQPIIPRVTPEELVTGRQRLGLSPEGLAAELNLTPGVVSAWERGRIRPSRRAEQWLMWRGAMLDRDEALASSGLAECQGIRTLAANLSDETRTRQNELVVAHVASCSTCLARRQFLAERFPPLPPPPLPGYVVALVWAQRGVDRAWTWLRGLRSR
jgi:DNA-binding transcriptional regulator YiaG